MRHDPLLVIFIALAVVFAMTLHVLVVEHHHPEEMGSGIHAYFHGQDKKLFVLAAMFQSFLFALVLIPFWRAKNGLEFDLEFLKSKLFSPLIL